MSISPGSVITYPIAKDLETIKQHQEELHDQHETTHTQLMSKLELTGGNIIARLLRNSGDVVAHHSQEFTAEISTVLDRIQKLDPQSQESKAELRALQDQFQLAVYHSKEQLEAEMRALKDRLRDHKRGFDEMADGSRQRSLADIHTIQDILQTVVLLSEERSATEIRALQGQLREQKHHLQDIVRRSQTLIQNDVRLLQDNLGLNILQFQDQSRNDIRALQNQLREMARQSERRLEEVARELRDQLQQQQQQMVDMRELLATALPAQS
jgi:hypothetical protein